MNLQTITVTGATGFIGCKMVTFLKKKGHRVRAVIRKHHELTRKQYELADEVLTLDLTQYEDALKAVDGVDGIFHFAANMGGVGFFNAHNYKPFMDNMYMDMNIMKACEAKKVKRMFYPASACAYPVHIQATEQVTPQLKEDMLIPANADQMYGWEKFTMILLAKEAPFDVRVGILNTIFGEYQEWKGERAKFPPSIVYKVALAKKNKKPIEIWGNGKQTRTFLYIDDALEKMYEVIMKNEYFGEVNIASDRIVTVQECADWLCEIAGVEKVYKYDLSKPSGVLARGIDNTKFYQHYEYRDKYSTKDGFKKLYQWMIKEIEKEDIHG